MERIGRYLVRRLLTASVFARLYQAYDPTLDRQVAVKVFAVDEENPEPPFPLEEWRRRFEREARVMAQCDHPHIAPIWESGHMSTGRPYYVMPFHRCNLRGLIGFDLDPDEAALRPERERPRALPVAQAITILRQVLSALVHIHAHGIVHRDVKASNVLLTSRTGGIARLCDFGLAKVGEGPDMNRGAWVGTENYTSPEQRADARSAAPSADVYAAGVLAYRLVAGRLPGPGAPAVEELDAPSWLRLLMSAAMAADPAARPDAAAFAAALMPRQTSRVTVGAG